MIETDRLKNVVIFDIPSLNNVFISFNDLFISLVELKNIHLKTFTKRTQV